MGKHVNYDERVKWKAVKLRLEGLQYKEIMDLLGIKNKRQIQTWMEWYKNGETHRFSQPMGKQYSYGKGPEGLSELEELKRRNQQLEVQVEILKKYREIERSWSQRLL